VKIGRSICLGGACVGGVIGGGAAFTVASLCGVEGLGLLELAAGGAIGVVAGWGGLLPLCLRLDREVDKIRRDVSAVARGDSDEPIRLAGALGPVRQAVAEACGEMMERLESAEARVRELEIRNNVSEAERQHAEAILHSLHDAVIVTDAFNELKMANTRAAEVLGFALDASLHKSIDEVIRDETLRRLINNERDLATPGHRKHVDYLIGENGSGGNGQQSGPPPMHYDVTLSSLPDVKKGVGGVVTILRDVTREREISQMKSDFVSKVSHELRTPLSSINAYIELLLDGEATDEESRHEFYEIIKNEADRLNRLIDNMLNISRIEAGIVKIDRTEVDLAKAIRRAVEVIQPQAKQRDIGIHVKTSPLACTAMADSDMIHQVLLNLMSNAVKYTPEGGRVTVSVENDDTMGGVMVTVADTGLGIPPDALPKVFDKFYRIENYKRVAKGTGLGLALVKHIVETVHHGQISVTSELGMGSKFTFTIPYDDDDRA